MVFVSDDHNCGHCGQSLTAEADGDCRIAVLTGSVMRLTAELAEAQRRWEADEDSLEVAWGVIANVSGGDWSQQSEYWRAAAARFRDEDWAWVVEHRDGDDVHVTI